MEIKYGNRIELHFRTGSALRRAYGARTAQSIIARLLLLSDCATLSDVPTHSAGGRTHTRWQSGRAIRC